MAFSTWSDNLLWLSDRGFCVYFEAAGEIGDNTTVLIKILIPCIMGEFATLSNIAAPWFTHCYLYRIFLSVLRRISG
jgi:hypothetical protein